MAPSTVVTRKIGHVFDDVMVGDDVAAGVDDDAGAHAAHAAGGVHRSGESGRLRRDLLAVDVDDRGPGALDRRNDRRHAMAARFRRGGVARSGQGDEHSNRSKARCVHRSPFDASKLSSQGADPSPLGVDRPAVRPLLNDRRRLRRCGRRPTDHGSDVEECDGWTRRRRRSNANLSPSFRRSRQRPNSPKTAGKRQLERVFGSVLTMRTFPDVKLGELTCIRREGYYPQTHPPQTCWPWRSA